MYRESNGVLYVVYESVWDLRKVDQYIPDSLFAYAKHYRCYITFRVCMEEEQCPAALSPPFFY
jgi:hypothetical protein